MIVLYWMTPDPIVVTEDQTLLEIHQVMREKSVRRLPVVRGEELCGIVGRTDLLPLATPTELSGPLGAEVMQRLAACTVGDSMTPAPHTCDAYDHVEEVSERMRRTKVGAFPVTNRGHLVGIISEMDLLRALAELSHFGKEGKRITVQIPVNKVDVLYNIVDLSRRCALELLAVLTHSILDESATMVTLRVRGSRVDAFVKHLWDAGYKVSDVS